MLLPDPYNYFKALEVSGKKFFFFLIATFLFNKLIFYFHFENAVISERLIMLLSSAIGIFLGFRINAAYTRWRDGMMGYRDLIAVCQTIVTSINMLAIDDKQATKLIKRLNKELTYLFIVYTTILRLELKDVPESEWDPLVYHRKINDENLLSEDQIADIKSKQFKSSYILTLVSEKIHLMTAKNKLHFITTGELCTYIEEIYRYERGLFGMKYIPFPWGYQFYTRLFVWLMPLLFMISAINQNNILDIILVAFTSTVFVTTEQVARNLDNPINHPFNSIPYEALSRILEISLLESLNIPNDLEIIKPYRGILN